jgi:hypothetical protein
MPIETRWYDAEKTILWFRYYGNWGWEDYTQTFYVEGPTLLAGITHPIGTLHEMTTFPPRASIALMSNTMRATPSQIVARVVVLNGTTISNILIRTALTVVARIALQSHRMHYASSVDEGAALLRRLLGEHA